MKHPLHLCILCFLSVTYVFGQNEGSVFTATGRGGAVNAFAKDYQAIGINPANLGLKHDYKIAFSLGEVGAGIGSLSLNRAQLNKFVSGVEEELTTQEKTEYSAAFAKTNALNLNADVMSFGFSFYLPKVGGFAISNRQRLMTHIGVNRNFANILFSGRNAPLYQTSVYTDETTGNEPLLSAALDGSTFQIAAFNEWNIAYGRQLVENDALKLAVGVGYRYVQGIGALDINITGGQVTAYNAMSAVFNVDYGNLRSDPSFQYVDSRGGYPSFSPAGTGHGLDVGISAEIQEKIRVGVSVTDLGSVRWKNNLLQAQDQRLQIVDSDGIRTANVFSEAATILGTGLITYQAGGERTVNLPTRLRAGIAYTASEKLDVGADFTMPLNSVVGNFPSPFVGVGVGYKPLKFIRLNTGFSAGAGYGWNIPLGIGLDFGTYELGLGTRSLTGLFLDSNPHVSAVFGVLRFKIGKTEEE